jgi:predicted kinase
MVLLLMKGSPGTGKSAVARELGRRLGWPVIDKDDIRDHLPDELGGTSYAAMLSIASTQLSLGLSVIADSPLGYGQSYQRALEVAGERAQVFIVETICSDEEEWRQRIAERVTKQLADHHATNWDKVEAFLSRSAQDPFTITVPRIVVDTAGRSPSATADEVVEALAEPIGVWDVD